MDRTVHKVKKMINGRANTLISDLTMYKIILNRLKAQSPMNRERVRGTEQMIIETILLVKSYGGKPQNEDTSQVKMGSCLKCDKMADIGVISMICEVCMWL